jgi:hypothetical protein
VAHQAAHPLSMVEELLPHVDMLLVMTVEPGFGGQAFIPTSVPKIAEAAAWRARTVPASASRWTAASRSTRSPRHRRRGRHVRRRLGGLRRRPIRAAAASEAARRRRAIAAPAVSARERRAS